MNNKEKILPVDADLAAVRELTPGPWLTQPWTLAERLHRIEVMGHKIDGYVQFMCQVANFDGASAEAKENAVTAFYDRMVIVEKQLGRIQENLRLQ